MRGRLPGRGDRPAHRTRARAGDFLRINAELTGDDRPSRPQARVPTLVRLGPTRTTLRVAVVGAGPAALFAADALLRQDGVQVTVFDRLPVPHGLARHGVAPDHVDTRRVAELFTAIENEPGFDYRLGVEVGRDITVAELAAHHHAVIYATGAGTDKPLPIPGTKLPGSMSATEVVAWYNGHPDHTATHVPLDSERAVIVGNGNVALDVARILATDPERLAATSIAPHALAALRGSRVREVVVLGRRGPQHAAFTLPELVGLAAREDIDLRVHAPEGIDVSAAPDRQTRLKLEYLAALPAANDSGAATGPDDSAGPGHSRRRIVLRFQASPWRSWEPPAPRAYGLCAPNCPLGTTTTTPRRPRPSRLPAPRSSSRRGWSWGRLATGDSPSGRAVRS
ncbi:FAD-dependent oxidoreductase [Dietzia aerolata]|uniref:FAD-dependent oxidoreductase n=1 Tax=Dietzia aerolata TaxID=595984 RepID=UPI00363465A8